MPFLGRTLSAQIHLTAPCDNVTITGKQFVNLTDDAVIIEGCNNVTVTANDFSGDVGGVYVLNSTNVTITWNRFRSIGNGTIGSGHSNFVQFNKTTGGSIAHNKGLGGNTEDMISLYQSGGASASSPLVVEDNAFESPLPPAASAWTSGSGSGAMVGDSGGAHLVVRRNTLLNVAQVGIGVPGGTDIHILDNVIYGAQRASSNVGIYVWNQSSGTCSGIEVSGNRVFWLNAAGAANAGWNAGNCGAVTNWTTNNTNVWQDQTINAVALRVSL